MATSSFNREFVITNVKVYKELICDNTPCDISSIHSYGESDRRKGEKLLRRCLSNSRK